MSKLIFIIDAIDTQTCHTPTKIANWYMNRFAIDEDAAFEVIAIESFSATEDHLEPSWISKLELDIHYKEFIDDLTIKTFDNFDRSKSAIEETLTKANLFEKDLNLFPKLKTNIHLIYCGNPFNWISGLDWVFEKVQLNCLEQKAGIIDNVNLKIVHNLSIFIFSESTNTLV